MKYDIFLYELRGGFTFGLWWSRKEFIEQYNRQLRPWYVDKECSIIATPNNI